MEGRRRVARRGAVEALYCLDLLADPPEPVLAEVAARLQLSPSASDFMRQLVFTTLEQQRRIDAVLSSTIQKWELSRLSYVDRAILRLGCCELLFMPEIPTAVSINEGVVLARFYGNEKSAQFVNGVLDAVCRAHPRKCQTEGTGRAQSARIGQEAD
ncbi:MAG: transcription antitermination factor NusB [candidate division WOR-3 bacterium]